MRATMRALRAMRDDEFAVHPRVISADGAPRYFSLSEFALLCAQRRSPTDIMMVRLPLLAMPRGFRLFFDVFA